MGHDGELNVGSSAEPVSILRAISVQKAIHRFFHPLLDLACRWLRRKGHVRFHRHLRRDEIEELPRGYG